MRGEQGLVVTIAGLFVIFLASVGLFLLGHPGDWGYVAEKLDLNRPDAEAVFAALQGVLV